MISNPEHGWCDFDLSDFHGHPSYLTDVPVDLLQAFIDLHEKGSGMAWFDEEGTEFSLVLTPYSMFIIEEKDNPVLYDYSETILSQLEKELIDDIRRDIGAWACFECGLDSDDEFQQKAIEIQNLMKELEKYLR